MIVYLIMGCYNFDGSKWIEEGYIDKQKAKKAIERLKSSYKGYEYFITEVEIIE